MMRETSAGGVVVRKREGEWWMVAIEPAKELTGSTEAEPETARTERTKTGRARTPILALPKGLVDPGEKARDTAVREVFEESGITAEPIIKLADIKYVYTRSWGDRQRVFKIVSFYLMRYRSGRIDEIAPEMRVEVARAQWIRLEDAPKMLAYSGEKKMGRLALEYVGAHPDLETES